MSCSNDKIRAEAPIVGDLENVTLQKQDLWLVLESEPFRMDCGNLLGISKAQRSARSDEDEMNL